MSLPKLLGGFVFVVVCIAIVTRVKFLKMLVYPPA